MELGEVFTQEGVVLTPLSLMVLIIYAHPSHEGHSGYFLSETVKLLEEKKISYGDLDFTYNIWQCKKEYLDFEQARKYEKFLIMKKVLQDKLITIERSMNYDGKTFFFRFPKELTGNLHKEDLVDIKLLSTDGRMFLVEIKHRH